MGNRIRMYFAVFGDWPTPDAVTTIVGRAPTSFRRKGDRVGDSMIVIKRSIWEIDSGLSEHAELEERLAALVSLLEEHESGIHEIVANEDVGIQCAAYWHTNQPGVHLSPDLISRLSAFGVSVDFDMYCMGDEEP